MIRGSRGRGQAWRWCCLQQGQELVAEVLGIVVAIVSRHIQSKLIGDVIPAASSILLCSTVRTVLHDGQLLRDELLQLRAQQAPLRERLLADRDRAHPAKLQRQRRDDAQDLHTFAGLRCLPDGLELFMVQGVEDAVGEIAKPEL